MPFIRRLPLILTLLSFFFLSACFTAFMQPPLPEQGLDMFADESSDVSVAVHTGRITVVVDIDDQGQSLARAAQLKVLLSSKIIGDLNAVGVDDLNRKADRKLIEEIKLIEVNGGVYEGPVLADYALLASFLESSYDVVYKKPIKFPFTDEAEYKKKAGTCDYAVTVHIGLKIKDLSTSARTVKSLNVKETEKDSFKTTNKNCPVSDNEKRKLARRITEKLAHCLTLPLQVFLAPRGRITASRRDEKGRTFFRLSTGSAGGLKVSDKMRIYHLSETGEREAASFAEGQVHKEIAPGHAWLMVLDESEAAFVKKGDLAVVSYESKLSQSRDWVKCRSIRTER